jgi:plastocyanin
MEHLGEPAMPPGKTHQVTVGGSAGLTFIPDSLVAEPGDMVQFHFLSKNHTVTQSGFAKPCVKLADGADSGFMPNPDETLNPPPTYKFQVMDKSAIWFYCKQKGHCGMGMTFSINPTEEKSQAKFRQLAMEQNGTANGSDGANGGYASPPAGSPSSIIPPPAAGTGVAASGVPPAPLANSTIYSVPALPPGQENKAPGSTGIVPPAPGATQPANVVKGTGNTDSGQCQCSCLCGVASFPAGSGVGSWGGMSGAVPV